MRPFVQGAFVPDQRTGASARRYGTVRAMFGKMSRLFGLAAAALVVAACSAAPPGIGPASPTSAAMPVTVTQSLHGSLGDRVLTAPIVMGGRLILPPLHRAPGHGYVPPAAKLPKHILYAGDINSGQVLLYNSNKPHPHPIGEIVDGLLCPAGVAVDGSGNVYVADDCTNNFAGSVTVYPAGQTSPSLTITDGINCAWGVAVDSQGNVFVTNLCNSAGSVTGYHAGQTSPFETIPQSSFGPYSQPVGLAADGSDNLWVTDDSHSTVFEIPAGSSQPQNAGLTQLKGPTGISFDASGNLYVTNFGGNNAAIYAPGSQNPTATITIGMDGPTANTVTSSGKFFQGNQGQVPPATGDIQGYPPGQNQPSSFIEIPETQGLAAAPIPSQKRKALHP
jgi:NHL repeat